MRRVLVASLSVLALMCVKLVPVMAHFHTAFGPAARVGCLASPAPVGRGKTQARPTPK